MVKEIEHRALYIGEIYHHTVRVQLLGAAVDGNNPVVAMNRCTLALVVEFKTVCGRFFEAFGNVVQSRKS